MYGTGNALIRFYYQIDPEKMTEEEWAIAVNDIQWVLKLQHEMMWGKGEKK